MPGMFLQQPIASSSTISTEESAEQERSIPQVTSETHDSGSSKAPSTSSNKHTGMRKSRPQNPRKPARQPVALPNSRSSKEVEQLRRVPAATLETHSVGSSNGPSTSEHRISGMRKHRSWNSRKPVEQWIRKENATAEWPIFVVNMFLILFMFYFPTIIIIVLSKRFYMNQQM